MTNRETIMKVLLSVWIVVLTSQVVLLSLQFVEWHRDSKRPPDNGCHERFMQLADTCEKLNGDFDRLLEAHRQCKRTLNGESL